MLSDTKHKRTSIIWLKVYKISRDGQFIETENRLKVTSGREWGMGVIARGYRTFFGKFWKLFQIDSGDGCMNCECTFFLLYTFHLYSAFCQLYLNKTGIKKENNPGHSSKTCWSPLGGRWLHLSESVYFFLVPRSLSLCHTLHLMRPSL